MLDSKGLLGVLTHSSFLGSELAWLSWAWLFVFYKDFMAVCGICRGNEIFILFRFVILINHLKGIGDGMYFECGSMEFCF